MIYKFEAPLRDTGSTPRLGRTKKPVCSDIWVKATVRKGEVANVGLKQSPPMQKGASFNLEAVKAQLMKAAAAHHGQ